MKFAVSTAFSITEPTLGFLVFAKMHNEVLRFWNINILEHYEGGAGEVKKKHLFMLNSFTLAWW